MKKWMLSLLMAVATVALVGVHADVEAKRLGGGKAAGMQRSMPAKSPDGTPAKPAQPANGAATPAQQGAAAAPAAAGAQAAAPKRSWMGPIAGLAAGLGIAALMSHLGMGEQFGNFLMMALLAVVAVVAIRWLMGRFARPAAQGPQLAGAGAPMPSTAQPFQGRDDTTLSPMQREARGLFTPPAAPAAGAVGGAVAPAAAGTVPADFDAAGFERIAKMIFIRLQAANDAANVDDLRKFTTPELFASLRLDLQERGASAQQTDVMQLEAELVDTSFEGEQYVASVRFHGLIREEAGAGAEPFNELWHLVKPASGQSEWAIAGITPLGE